MKKIKTEMAITGIGTMLVIAVLMLGIVLSGVFASDMPEEEVIEKEVSEIIESIAQDDAAEAEVDIAEPAEAEAQYESEASEIPEEPVTALAKAEYSDNFISGVIWLDENEDGIMDPEETGIGEFPVSLYQDDQVIDVTETDTDGGYRFEQLEPGEYVIGVQLEVIEGTEYLIPLCGISGDNKFELTELADGSVVALSDTIEVATDTLVEDVNAGMRLPMGIMPVAGETYIVTRASGGSLGDYNSLVEAVDACETNVPCVITVTKDDTLTAAIEIPADKEITLESDTGNSWTITQEAVTTGSSNQTARHFTVKGNLTIENITLAGQGFAAADFQYNGGVYIENVADAKFAINSGAAIVACCNYNGGGVYVASSGEFEMDGGEISGNEVRSNGGGVYLYSGSEFKMKNSKISDNEARSSGGGVYVNGEFEMDGGEISDNEAGSNGGGVYLYSGSEFKMKNSKISDNEANYGGGVYLYSGSEFKMDGGEISDNEAYYGGGVYLYSGSEFKMKNGKISDNEARSSSGGGVYVDGEFEMDSGEISGNEARGNGGGVYLYNNSEFKMKNSKISGNTTSSMGGGVYVSGTFEMTDGSGISNNKASYGGGVYLYNSEFKMDGGEISSNTATNSGGGGGGVYLYNSEFEMDSGEISGNVSSGVGGGVCVVGTFKMTNSEISGNEAGSSGGGVHASGEFEMNGGKISDNTMTANASTGTGGGGVYVNGTFKMYDGEIRDNKMTGTASGTGGGGVYVRGTFEMYDGEISDNTMTSDGITSSGGGGVYVDGEFEMTDGEISGNTAGGNGCGGGVYVYSTSEFEMTDGEISGNTAGGDGGGIYTGDYSYDNPADLAKYSNITIGTVATVQNNTAANKNALPVNYASFTGFPGNLLDNNEINYKGPYLITYDANNGMGESQIIKEASSGTGDVEVTLLTASEVNFTPPVVDVVLTGWNTQADGNGTPYTLGEKIQIQDNITLYAVWEQKQNDFKVDEEYKLQDGTWVPGQAGTSTTVTAGADYEQTAPILAGYRYLGYQIDGGTMQSGAEVKISQVDKDYTVTFLYEEYNETIHISVPVKLLWAAFEDDKGEVTSPEYYFYNHSSHAISVTMQDLTISKRDGLDLVASTTADSGADEVALQLNPIEDSRTGWRSSSISQLSLLDGNSGLLGKIEADSRGIFDIIGTYGGYFKVFDPDLSDALQPKYKAVFRFELTN